MHGPILPDDPADVNPIGSAAAELPTDRLSSPKWLTAAGRIWNTAATLKTKKRNILVILSNRFNRNQKPRFLELDCDDQGNIVAERPLRRQPREPRYHEVWENDDGRTSLSSCYRLSRKYRHPLEKRAA